MTTSGFVSAGMAGASTMVGYECRGRRRRWWCAMAERERRLEWNAKGGRSGLRREARGASARMGILTLARAVGIRSDWPEDAVRFPLAAC